jgi:hypothetical protein
MTELGEGVRRDRGAMSKGRKARKVEYVRIPKQSEASLWMLRAPGNPEPRVVSFHCPTCRDPDSSRLVHINVPTEPRYPRRKNARRRAKQPVRLLMHVTRDQIEQILADFGKKDNSSTLRAIFYHKDDSNGETDPKLGPTKTT